MEWTSDADFANKISISPLRLGDPGEDDEDHPYTFTLPTPLVPQIDYHVRIVSFYKHRTGVSEPVSFHFKQKNAPKLSVAGVRVHAKFAASSSSDDTPIDYTNMNWFVEELSKYLHLPASRISIQEGLHDHNDIVFDILPAADNAEPSSSTPNQAIDSADRLRYGVYEQEQPQRPPITQIYSFVLIQLCPSGLYAKECEDGSVASITTDQDEVGFLTSITTYLMGSTEFAAAVIFIMVFVLAYMYFRSANGSSDRGSISKNGFQSLATDEFHGMTEDVEMGNISKSAKSGYATVKLASTIGSAAPDQVDEEEEEDATGTGLVADFDHAQQNEQDDLLLHINDDDSTGAALFMEAVMSKLGIPKFGMTKYTSALSDNYLSSLSQLYTMDGGDWKRLQLPTVIEEAFRKALQQRRVAFDAVARKKQQAAASRAGGFNLKIASKVIHSNSNSNARKPSALPSNNNNNNNNSGSVIKQSSSSGSHASSSISSKKKKPSVTVANDHHDSDDAGTTCRAAVPQDTLDDWASLDTNSSSSSAASSSTSAAISASLIFDDAVTSTSSGSTSVASSSKSSKKTSPSNKKNNCATRRGSVE